MLRIKSIFLTIMLLSIGTSCYALDSSIYWGTWKTIDTDKNTSIILVIKNDKDINLEINGKKLNNLKHSFCHCGKPSIYPFLSLTAAENDNLHYLYLSIGSKGKNADLNLLRGFYEFSTLTDQVREIVETVSSPIELQKIE